MRAYLNLLGKTPFRGKPFVLPPWTPRTYAQEPVLFLLSLSIQTIVSVIAESLTQPLPEAGTECALLLPPF